MYRVPFLGIATAVFGVTAFFILVLVMGHPYRYLAPDSFIYFTVARTAIDDGVLFSYSGVDHTTGVHPLYYGLLVILFPIFGVSLPAGSLLLGAVLLSGALVIFWRVFGTAPALFVGILFLTPWGMSFSNNGVESALLIFLLSILLLAFRVLDMHRELSRRLCTAGVVLGLISAARLDTIFFAISAGVVFAFQSLSLNLNGIRTSAARAALIIAGAAAILVPSVALYWVYGDSPVPISGALKSSFPVVQDDWAVTLLSLKTFILGILVSIVGYAASKVHAWERRLFLALTIGLALLWLYNGLFVSNIGVWYSALPFFAVIVFVAHLISKFIPSHAIPVVGLLAVLFGAPFITHLHLSIEREDWITPHQAAAAFLDGTIHNGAAAAELKDGEVAFFASTPVYSLTGLANNVAYVHAVQEGRLSEYLSERGIQYIVGGSYGSGVQVPGGEALFSSCTNPLYAEPLVQIYRVKDCL